jgi:hypothetical protein
VPAKQSPAKCMVVGDSMVCSVRADHTNMRVARFLGIRAEQLHKVIEERYWLSRNRNYSRWNQ